MLIKINILFSGLILLGAFYAFINSWFILSIAYFVLALIFLVIGTGWEIDKWGEKKRVDKFSSNLARLQLEQKRHSESRELKGLVINLKPSPENIDSLQFTIVNKTGKTLKNIKIHFRTLLKIEIYNIDSTYMHPQAEDDPPLEIGEFFPESEIVFSKNAPGVLNNHHAHEKEVAYLEFDEDSVQYKRGDRRWTWINIKLPGVKAGPGVLTPP